MFQDVVVLFWGLPVKKKYYVVHREFAQKSSYLWDSPQEAPFGMASINTPRVEMSRAVLVVACFGLTLAPVVTAGN